MPLVGRALEGGRRRSKLALLEKCEAVERLGPGIYDFDNDGRVDLVLTTLGEHPVLLRNTYGQGNHWLGLRPMGVRSNRDATAVGYAGSREPAVHFG